MSTVCPVSSSWSRTVTPSELGWVNATSGKLASALAEGRKLPSCSVGAGARVWSVPSCASRCACPALSKKTRPYRVAVASVSR